MSCSATSLPRAPFELISTTRSTISSGGVGSIDEQLRSVNNYHGVSGMISFDNEDGVNSEAAILKISNKKFIRIQ